MISILQGPHTLNNSQSQSGSVVMTVSCCSRLGKNMYVFCMIVLVHLESVLFLFLYQSSLSLYQRSVLASGFCAVVIIVFGWDKLLKKNHCYFIVMHHVCSVGSSVAFFIAWNFHTTACNSEVGLFGVNRFLSSEITFLFHHTLNNFIRLNC